MNEELNKENYKLNHDYLSFSRLSTFIKCEEAAFDYSPQPKKTAFLVGSYVDAYFSDEMDEFKMENPEIYNSRTGELKQDFKIADKLIERLERDPLASHFLSGEKQVIMTGEIAGVPFKIKMDSYLKDEAICDLKVMKDFCKVFNPSIRASINFVEAYNYDIELAIFQEIVRQNTGKTLPCYLVCVTKEDEPDIGIFQIPQEKLDEALDIVYNNLPRFIAIRDGKIRPYRCENCSHCKRTKKAQIISYEFAGMTGDQLRDEGYECLGDYVTTETK